jgi:hypothetical protein
VVTNAEKSMDVAKFMKLIARPPLELFLGQPAGQQQLPHRMRSWMSLTQGFFQIRDQFFWSQYSSHNSSDAAGMRRRQYIQSVTR